MHSLRSLTVALALLGAIGLSHATAAETHEAAPAKPHGELVPVAAKDAAWAAKQKASYPTNMCVVSGDKLGGDMGEPADYIYRVDGKPDRLISFCCKDCVKDFNENPDKYLKALDAAAAKPRHDAPPAGHSH